jgi:DNA adenine methylase Dam
MKQLIKSVMNYTGGKYKLLPQILPLFPEKIDTFIDLFAGGLDVSINVEANKIISNDIMYPLINLYEEMQRLGYENTLNHINNRISQFQLSKTNKEGYLKLRELYNKEKYPLDLYVLICYSFNNSIRFNSKMEFNIAFGENRSEFNEALRNRLPIFINKLKTIRFYNKSFMDLKLDKLKQNDFLYADPPYLITIANYNENNGWNDVLENELYSKLDEVNSKGIKFALSNVLTHKGKTNDILIEWSKKYNIHHLNVNYSNCNYQTKDKTTKSDEVLITNY